MVKNKEDILGVLDNDKNKIGKFLYGFDLRVFNPEILNKYENPHVYMRIGAYSKEIRNQILKINKNAKFI